MTDPSQAVSSGMSAQNVTVIVTGIITVIGAIVAGAISIITTLRQTKRAITTGQDSIAAEQKVSKARSLSRDRKIQEIHLMVNSRLTTVLRLLVAVTKKEAERTRSSDDVHAYEEASAELHRAETADRTLAVVTMQEARDELQEVEAAEQQASDARHRADN